MTGVVGLLGPVVNDLAHELCAVDVLQHGAVIHALRLFRSVRIFYHDSSYDRSDVLPPAGRSRVHGSRVRRRSHPDDGRKVDSLTILSQDAARHTQDARKISPVPTSFRSDPAL